VSIRFALLHPFQHHRSRQDLAAHLHLAFADRRNRALPRLDALLPQFELCQALLQRGNLIIEFGHGGIVALIHHGGGSPVRVV
jgi:hypothetical protein